MSVTEGIKGDALKFGFYYEGVFPKVRESTNRMVIDKIINNNIVSAFDEKGLEVVIMVPRNRIPDEAGTGSSCREDREGFPYQESEHSRTAQGIAGEDAA